MNILDEKRFFSVSVTSNSVKLLIVNTILYIVFLQAFILGSLTEQFNKYDMPLFTYIAGGLFALFYILIWANMGDMLYRHLKKPRQVLRTAIWSEVPFLAIMVTLWITFSEYWSFLDDTVKMLMLIISMYLVIYPLVLVLSKMHREQAKKFEK